MWVHGQHLLADGVKMAKSSGNSFVLADIEGQGIDPLAFRYLCLTARYRNRLNFTFSSLKAAQLALLRLRNRVWTWGSLPRLPEADGAAVQEAKGRFLERVDDNLDMPRALALTWELVRSESPERLKLEVLREYDKILGLDLDGVVESYQVSEEINSLVEQRARLRKEGNYPEADAIRSSLDQAGYVLEDTPTGSRVRPKTAWEQRQEEWPTVSSSAEVPSLMNEADGADVTVGIVACNYLDDLKRCVQSALRWVGVREAEVVVVDNGSTDGTGPWLKEAVSLDSRIRVVHTDHILGEGAARNIVLKQSRGKNVVLMDTSAEVVGDVFGPIEALLSDESIGVVGPFGLRTDDLHHFHDGEGEAGDMDAMQAYCFAYRRRRAEGGGLDCERASASTANLDLDYSFHFKDKGFRIVADPSLAVRRHHASALGAGWPKANGRS